MRSKLCGAALFILHLTWAATCPAVTILQKGKSLVLTGTADSDLIEIVDHGGGSLTVNGADYSGIEKLTIDARAGADEVYYETEGVLSLSDIEVGLGEGDDIADLQLGAVVGKLRSLVEGADGADTVMTTFDAVLAGGDALSVITGGSGDDVIMCGKFNVMAGGRAECNSDGGLGDDTIMCAAGNIAGHSSCISAGGSGDDVVFCSISGLLETGSALCFETGGAGNDVMTCSKADISGEHVCFGDGGSGNDTMNWVVTGANSGDFDCSMFGGDDHDDINIVIVGAEGQSVNFTGTARYSADAGPGDDVWTAAVFLDDASDGKFESSDVFLESGDDTAVLGFQSVGQTEVVDGVFSGGAGVDSYVGPPPQFLQFPVVGFELGV